MLTETWFVMCLVLSCLVGCAVGGRRDDEEGDGYDPLSEPHPDLPVEVEPVGWHAGGEDLGHTDWTMEARLQAALTASFTAVQEASYKVENDDGTIVQVRIGRPQDSPAGLAVTVDGEKVAASIKPGLPAGSGGLPRTMKGKVRGLRVRLPGASEQQAYELRLTAVRR